MLMRLGLVSVLANAVRSNAHAEEANTGVTFGYTLIANVLSAHGSLENRLSINLMGIILIGTIPILLTSFWLFFTPYLQ